MWIVIVKNLEHTKKNWPRAEGIFNDTMKGNPSSLTLRSRSHHKIGNINMDASGKIINFSDDGRSQ